MAGSADQASDGGEVVTQRGERRAVRPEPDGRRRVVGHHERAAAVVAHLFTQCGDARTRGRRTTPPRCRRAPRERAGRPARSAGPATAGSAPTSARRGLRLPGGRHFRTLATATSERSRPASASRESSSWPERPTKGTPGEVLLRAGRLTDQHHVRARLVPRTVADHHRRTAEQRARGRRCSRAPTSRGRPRWQPPVRRRRGRSARRDRLSRCGRRSAGRARRGRAGGR